MLYPVECCDIRSRTMFFCGTLVHATFRLASGYQGFTSIHPGRPQLDHAANGHRATKASRRFSQAVQHWTMRETVTELHKHEGDGVELRHMYADACAMELVRLPKQFDVILAGNLFGDMK